MISSTAAGVLRVVTIDQALTVLDSTASHNGIPVSRLFTFSGGCDWRRGLAKARATGRGH